MRFVADQDRIRTGIVQLCLGKIKNTPGLDVPKLSVGLVKLMLGLLPFDLYETAQSPMFVPPGLSSSLP